MKQGVSVHAGLYAGQKLRSARPALQAALTARACLGPLVRAWKPASFAALRGVEGLRRGA